ncbi:protease inhibitor [Clostridiales bacterium]|nr:protease inhibitor [Clostridiales bacterium]
MKLLKVFVAVSLAFIMSTSTAFGQNNGNETDMIPLRQTAEKLGYDVTWLEDDNAAVIDSGNISATIYCNQNRFVSKNGYASELSHGSELIDGSIYVPKEFFEYYFFIDIDEKGDIIACEPQEGITVLSELAALENGNWQKLTKEQMLQDFDYLYKTLEENYPFIDVIKRMYNVDLKAEYENSRKLVEACKTDAEFFTIIDRFTSKAQMAGHLSEITPMNYDWYVEAYNNTTGIPEDYLGQMKKLALAYGNEKSKKYYGDFSNIFWPVFERVQAFYADLENIEDIAESQTEYHNVETKIIEDGKIAYIAVNSLDMLRYEEDKKTLFDFYEQIKDYENVIFDFTNNGGGGTSYFEDLIVAPNIDKPLTANVYQYIKNGEYNNKFLELSDYTNISEAPKLPNMSEDDLKKLDKVCKIEYIVKPLNDHKMLNGKLWLLVSERVFSSAEYAAIFSKTTGFATLVGTQTGGDGIGSDPLPLILPNSGMIVRYSAIYGTTADGQCNQEFRTIPDIVSENGEDALTTCLKAIGKK